MVGTGRAKLIDGVVAGGDAHGHRPGPAGGLDVMWGVTYDEDLCGREADV